MSYISAKETAEKWGISKARVIVLAREGRITGAQLIGNSWMIPDDSTKPADGRLHNTKQQSYKFRFPLLTFYPFEDDSFLHSLSEEETKLLIGQLNFEKCEYKKSYNILSELLIATDNVYIKIGSLYYLCLYSFISNNNELFQNCFIQLNTIFSQDFPYKTDISTILLDIAAITKGTHSFITDFHIQDNYSYHPDVIPYLAVQAAYYEAINPDIHLHEASFHSQLLICKQYENTGHYHVAERIYLYRAFSYFKRGLINKTASLLSNAFEIGSSHDLINIMANFYPYIFSIFTSICSSLDKKTIETIRTIGQKNVTNTISFIGSNNSSAQILLGLSDQQRQLMFYAVVGYTNKEISDITGIPEYTIRRKYEALFNQFNIPKKKKLGEYYIKLITNGYM